MEWFWFWVVLVVIGGPSFWVTGRDILRTPKEVKK